MTEQQYSKHFDPDTDNEYKNQEFESGLTDWIVGLIQHYPHLIEKSVIDRVEIWILRVMV